MVVKLKLKLPKKKQCRNCGKSFYPNTSKNKYCNNCLNSNNSVKKK